MLFAIPQVFSSPLSPSLCPGAPPDLLRPPLWYEDWQALLWCHVNSCVSGGLGCEVDVMFVSCRRLLKYIMYEILHRKER